MEAGNWGHLDHSRYAVNKGYQCRVVQLLWWTVLHERREAFVRPAARTDNVRTRAEGNPVQIELGLTLSTGLPLAPMDARHDTIVRSPATGG